MWVRGVDVLFRGIDVQRSWATMYALAGTTPQEFIYNTGPDRPRYFELIRKKVFEITLPRGDFFFFRIIPLDIRVTFTKHIKYKT